MLDSVCPIDGDCGRLCGAACCTAGDTDGEELGIYLYPGEEKLHSRKDDWLRRIMNFRTPGAAMFIS